MAEKVRGCKLCVELPEVFTPRRLCFYYGLYYCVKLGPVPNNRRVYKVLDIVSLEVGRIRRFKSIIAYDSRTCGIIISIDIWAALTVRILLIIGCSMCVGGT